MAITLFGTVCDPCDIAGNFTTNNSGVNISGDDDAVENGLAVGDKMSNTTELIVSDALVFTTSTVYDFSSAGATTDEGAHFIGWINTKTPIDVTDGIAVMFRNAAGHEGTWNVMPSFFYKGGFATRVINPSADFDTVTTWSVSGNPAQLDDVTEMGFQYHTVTSIMGSFNNVQCDQFIVGFGVRVDVGTIGTPNTYQDVVDEDQDVSFWGWHSSVGAKGGLYIGPATGDTASWFVDTNFAIKFLDENVAAGFYKIDVRGGATTCSWTLANLSAQNTAVARWSLNVDPGVGVDGGATGLFSDAQGTWSGSDTIVLNIASALLNTTIIDGNSLTQNGADMDGVTVIEPTVGASAAYILADDPDAISDCTFNANSGNTGHALEFDTATPLQAFTFSGNSFPGFTTTGAGDNLVENSGPTNAMILNSSGEEITINISGGGATPVIRNVGSGSITNVNNNVAVTLTGMRDDTEVRVCATGDPNTPLAGIENATDGTTDDRSFTFSLGAGVVVDIIVFNIAWILPPNNRIDAFEIPTLDTSLPISQVFDRNFENN